VIRAWLLLLALITTWGTHWVVVKIGLGTIPPFTYGALRLAGGIVILALLMALSGRLTWPRRHDWPIIVSYGVLAIGLGITMMNLSLPHIPAGRSSILAYTIPLWVVPVMAVTARTLPTRWEVVGLILGLLGLVLLLNPAAIDWTAEGALLGSLLLIIGALGSAVALVHVRRHPWQGTPFDAQIWQLIVALVPMLVFMVLLEGDQVADALQPSVPLFLAIVYSGFLATAFAYWASQMIVKALGPLTTGIGYLGTPMVGVIVGMLVLGETLSTLDLAGIAVTVAAIVIVLLAQRPRGRSEPLPAIGVTVPDGAELTEVTAAVADETAR
jgi:drug/metabolite transporter (DMT)-like permease